MLIDIKIIWINSRDWRSSSSVRVNCTGWGGQCKFIINFVIINNNIIIIIIITYITFDPDRTVDGGVKKPKYCSRRQRGPPTGTGQHWWKDTTVWYDVGHGGGGGHGGFGDD